MTVASFTYATLGKPAGFIFAFSFACYSLSNVLKGRKMSKISKYTPKTGETEKGLRIFLVKLALIKVYAKKNIPFNRAREFSANYYNQTNYTVRKERNSKLDIVCSKNSICIYEYSPDMREHPLIKNEFNNLNDFLKHCITNYIRQNVRPGLSTMLNQIKEKGKIDHLAASKARQDAKPAIESMIESMHKYIDSSKYVALLSKLTQ